MTTYYEKRGKKYVPVLERDVWGGETWPTGCHLVVCKPGIRTIRYNIEPNDCAYLAAQTMYADDLAKIFLDASRAECQSEPLTEEQQSAWSSMRKAFDGGPYFVKYDSALSMAKKFLEILNDINNKQNLAK